MDIEGKCIVETFLEADVTSADGARTCHASMGGAIGIDPVEAKVSPLEAAKLAVREQEKHRWLETFLRETAQWDPQLIQGASAACKVRSKVMTRSAEGKKPEGEFEFEENVVVGLS